MKVIGTEIAAGLNTTTAGTTTGTAIVTVSTTMTETMTVTTTAIITRVWPVDHRLPLLMPLR